MKAWALTLGYRSPVHLEGLVFWERLLSLRLSIAVAALITVSLLPTGAQAAAGWALSLAQASQLARLHNHDLRLARYAIKTAQANLDIAAVAPNPTLSVQAAGMRSGTMGGSLPDKAIDTTVRVDQLIERGGKRELRSENARNLAAAARADSADIERQIDLLVAAAYADLLAAQERRLAMIESAQLFDAMLVAAQKRKNAGDIAGADVERVKVDALRAKNDRAAVEGELSAARHALALLLGEGERAAEIEASDPWPALALLDNAAQINAEQIVNERADVRAAQARVEAARSVTQLAQSLRTRDVTVGVQFEHYPGSGDGRPSSANSVGISMQIPLFVRHYYQGEILYAESNLDSARENLVRVRDAAGSQIQSARVALQHTAERVKRNRDELLVSAAKAAKAAEFAYQNGALGVMDVLDARRTLRATRLDAVAALADYSKAIAQWRASITTSDAILELTQDQIK